MPFARKLLVLCCALAPGVAPQGASADVPVAPPDLPVGEVVEEKVGALAPPGMGTGAEPAMVTAVNRARAARKLGPLSASGALNRSAHRYASWMLREDYFGHLSRIRAGGGFRRTGEALALHFGRRAQVRRTVRRWLRSPAHRSLLLSRRYSALGAGQAVGLYRGRRATTWVLHFGA
jgi:uncharacterized protein YkwD